MASTLRSRRLAEPGDGVLVAFSGGPDSTALLAALGELVRAGFLAWVRACHVDHGLRPGSADDARHCQAVCLRLGVPLERRAVQVGPGNLQAAARQARYAALREVAAAAGARRIATGHTRTDQAETVLLRLLRGSGARGLAAIPARRGLVVRPLLDLGRDQVLAYLRQRRLPWLEDPSNATGRFLRNRVRQQLWPALLGLAPSAEGALARAADLLRADDRALDALARALVGWSPRVSAAALRGAPLAVRRRAVLRLWRNAAGSRRGLAAAHVASALRLLRRGRPGQVALPGGLVARAFGGQLEIARPAAPPASIAPVAVPGPGAYPVPGRGQRLVVGPSGPLPGGLRLGTGAVAWPLQLRHRVPGDRFRPAGGSGSKKLKAWLIDRKVPREARDRLLLLADAAGRVLWLPDLPAAAAGLPGEGPELEVRLLPER